MQQCVTLPNVSNTAKSLRAAQAGIALMTSAIVMAVSGYSVQGCGVLQKISTSFTFGLKISHLETLLL